MSRSSPSGYFLIAYTFNYIDNNMKHLPITLLSLLASASVFAQTGGNDPVLATPAFAGADCVTLLDSTAVQVAETGSGTFTVHKKFKVQTEKGAVANHIVKYDYDPLTAFAEFRYATIYREGGDVVNVDVTQACDYAAPARAIYWGARQIMLDLGRLNPGDVVEYEIHREYQKYAGNECGDGYPFEYSPFPVGFQGEIRHGAQPRPCYYIFGTNLVYYGIFPRFRNYGKSFHAPGQQDEDGKYRKYDSEPLLHLS